MHAVLKHDSKFWRSVPFWKPTMKACLCFVTLTTAPSPHFVYWGRAGTAVMYAAGFSGMQSLFFAKDYVCGTVAAAMARV